MDNNVGFDLSESFNIDEDQLDGLSPQKVFVLGYELAQVSAELGSGNKVAKPVHPQNRERIEAAAKKRDRLITFTVYHDDWLWLLTIDDEAAKSKA